MHARPDEVGARRLRRRLKAVLSIGVAICAGLYLACQKSVTSAGAGGENGGRDDATTPNAAGGENGGRDDATTPNAAPTNSSDANAMVHMSEPTRDAAVDRREHRKGMPVPDNLLE